MIRMIQSSSSRQAKAYFLTALSKSDYYLNEQELQGFFEGKLASRLGVEGPATKEAFFSLSDNRIPGTNQNLTPRKKDERRVGYDINFHCPKSVSILHALSNDDHILTSFQESVRETMRDIESDSKTRVRKNGAQEDRATGELVWANFIHQTARPVEGSVPDPHLHAHCFVFNVTWDQTEEKYKAGQFGNIKRDMPYYQAMFHKRFADKLMDLGYAIKPTQQSFEIEGIPKHAIELFSKRTDQIGRVAKELGITSAKELAELGARTRNKKERGLSMQELKEDWKHQLRNLEKGREENGMQIVRNAPEKNKQLVTLAKSSIDFAVLHSFERASVMPERRLLETAYRHAIGNKGSSVVQIAEAFKGDERIIHIQEKGNTVCTTREVLSEEQRMVTLARLGQSKHMPLYVQAPEIKLEGQQADALRRVLTTKDRVSIIRGGAGTGKTTMMNELKVQIEKAGKKLFSTAPTAGASRGVLRESGHEKADTVSRLMIDEKMKAELKNQVLLVDEAGLLGTKDMTALLDLTQKQNTQLILCGDTRQHSSVIRGDALRILNIVAGIQPAEVTKNFRQKNAEYKSAVNEIAEGRIKNGFEKLEKLGAIRSIDPLKPDDQMIKDVVASIKKKNKTLVISPTHKQGQEITEAIRHKLREEKFLGKKEISVRRIINLNYTEAQKSDWRNFTKDQIVQFSQNAPSFKRGSVWMVQGIHDNTVILKNEDGNENNLLMSHAKAFDVFEEDEMRLSKGDRVRITRNGFDANGRRLDNGDILEVKSVSKSGRFVLINKQSKSSYVIDKSFGHLSHAHCITSHASQGKTVDEVFIYQPACTFAATDAKQFYVSVSRAKNMVHIYTDNKDELLEHASEMGNRLSAMEVVNDSKKRLEYFRQLNSERKKTVQQSKFLTKTQGKDKDYER